MRETEGVVPTVEVDEGFSLPTFKVCSKLELQPACSDRMRPWAADLKIDS